MTSTTGSDSEIPDGPPVEGSIQSAMRRVDSETKAIESTCSALNAFRVAVGEVPATLSGSDEADTLHERMLSQQADGTGGVEAVLAAFRDTIGVRRDEALEGQKATLQTLGDEFRKEISQNLSIAATQNCFPPQLKVALIVDVEVKLTKYESTRRALDQEMAALTDVESVLDDVHSAVEEYDECRTKSADLTWLAEKYEDLEMKLAKLDGAAARRQELLNARTGNREYRIDHHRLVEMLYTEFTTQYPALREISKGGETCKATQRAILRQCHRLS